MKKITLGKVYAVDINNEMKQKWNGLNFVIPISRVSWRPFKGSIYRCRDNNGIVPHLIEINQKCLYDVSSSITRIDADIPEINDVDIKSLEYAISMLSKLFIYNGEIEYKSYTDKLNRLKALNEKLKLYKEMREI